MRRIRYFVKNGVVGAVEGEDATENKRGAIQRDNGFFLHYAGRSGGLQRGFIVREIPTAGAGLRGRGRATLGPFVEHHGFVQVELNQVVCAAGTHQGEDAPAAVLDVGRLPAFTREQVGPRYRRGGAVFFATYCQDRQGRREYIRGKTLHTERIRTTRNNCLAVGPVKVGPNRLLPKYSVPPTSVAVGPRTTMAKQQGQVPIPTATTEPSFA